MYYHIQLVGSHYVKITDVIEVISVTSKGRFDYHCFPQEVVFRVFSESTEKKEISKELYELQAKAWAEYRKANTGILGDAVPELIEDKPCFTPGDCECYYCQKEY